MPDPFLLHVPYDVCKGGDLLAEQIFPSIFRIEVPIPHSPLKATNAYVIKGEKRNLLVDTGQNRPESLAVLQAGLAELSIDMTATDIFLTHMHADHSGLLPLIKTEGTRIFASAKDAESVNYMLTAQSPMERLFQAACRNGFSPEEARQAIQRHPGSDTGERKPLNFSLLSEGEKIEVAGYQFTCIATPGHTKGHLCLYEENKKLLLSGDHVLGDISPNITHYLGNDDPLADFLASLQLIEELTVDTVLPGHRRIFHDCRGRIKELKEHHRGRAEEALVILADGPMSGYQVAARMTWDMVFRSWEEVAPTQKYFATGEALSHIHYLEKQGWVGRVEQEENILYYRK